MDRREALRKLGIGGAVAFGTPVLIDSFNIAHASSAEVCPEPPEPTASGSGNSRTLSVPAEFTLFWQTNAQDSGFQTVTGVSTNALVITRPTATPRPTRWAIRVDVAIDCGVAGERWESYLVQGSW